jgi:hypothetical protein
MPVSAVLLPIKIGVNVEVDVELELEVEVDIGVGVGLDVEIVLVVLCPRCCVFSALTVVATTIVTLIKTKTKREMNPFNI